MHAKAAAYTLRRPPLSFPVRLNGEPKSILVYSVDAWDRLPVSSRVDGILSDDGQHVLVITPRSRLAVASLD